MTDTGSGAARLVLGPMLRYVSETEATVWVETDRACQVEILGRAAATFEVAGHHYGLVLIDGLAPGSEREYQVALDGAVRWPEPGGDFPPSVLRTLSPAGSGRELSFALFDQLLTGLATGEYRERGEPPASVTVISGDVHHSYLTAVDLPAGIRSGTAVYQAVCSPFRQWMPPLLRRAQRLGGSRPGGLLGTAVARLAGARDPAIRWRITEGPWFENMLAVLEFRNRQASVTFSRVASDHPPGTPGLTPARQTRLS